MPNCRPGARRLSRVATGPMTGNVPGERLAGEGQHIRAAFQRAVVHRTWEYWRHRGRAGRRGWPRCGRRPPLAALRPGRRARRARPATAGYGRNSRLRRAPARPRVTGPAA